MRVGIPKSLMYYKLFPLWKTFLQELGMEVVTSDGEVHQIVRKGVPFFEDSCLPLKLLIPHSQSLVGKVDVLFLPRLISLDRRYILCPKFRGAPDVLRLALKDRLEIWDGVIDLRKGGKGLTDFLLATAKRTGVDPKKVRQAYRRGQERYQLFIAELTDRINRLRMEEIFELETPCPSSSEHQHPRHTVAFIGRSYNLFDPFISKDLLPLAKGLGITVVTSHAIPFHERERIVLPLSKEIYWETAREIVGSILYFAEHGIADGIVFVTSFKCGIDALMQEFLKRTMGKNQWGNIPFMTLTFDEHTTAEGIRTRLEAFLDLIDQRKGNEE
jgi:predicted nucleotide-binding protein (sugar kinase/HSP70/actin superfamily)